MIYFPPGIYDVDDVTPVANGSYTFAGAGEDSIIRHLGTGTGSMFKQIGAGETGADDNVTRFFISDMTIDGNRAVVLDLDLPAIELDVVHFQCFRVNDFAFSDSSIRSAEAQILRPSTSSTH